MTKRGVTPPAVLGTEQVKFAQQFVKMRFSDGLPIAEACKALGHSTATLYKWKEQPAFESYLNALESDMVNEDEREAYKSVKAYIIRMVNVKNPTDKHVDMFFKYFEYVVNAENARRMSELGIATNTQDFKTIEERKASLLSRLRS